jgi:hypothetical protein
MYNIYFDEGSAAARIVFVAVAVRLAMMNEQ